uniref:Uncharacterized protein n=1 Tax=Oryzias sinensis TaxID=183150 RepID=A0A8C7YC22_9TELE
MFQKLHLEMLSDRSRTETYRQVILSNSASLRNKVVMDLGCGTGIISMFCAQLAKPSAVISIGCHIQSDTYVFHHTFHRMNKTGPCPQKIYSNQARWLRESERRLL